jgi:hypothetical protein
MHAERLRLAEQRARLAIGAAADHRSPPTLTAEEEPSMQTRIIPTLVAAFALTVALGAGAVGAFFDPPALEAGSPPYEVWAIDQSGDAGKLYVYYGRDLEHRGERATPEVIDLAAVVTPLCLAQTGTAPVRAHMIDFNHRHTHAILAYVASGHVVFFEAASRRPVACLDAGAQAHAAHPAPNDAFAIVANQNGKLLQRITTDYATNAFALDAAATLDLAACTTPNGLPCQDPALRPDNAPVCPLIDQRSRLAFVTLRGGGLFVIDATATPLRIVAEYDQVTVRPNGCGGIERDGLMYINAGGGTPANPTESHLYAFPLRAYDHNAGHAPNTPRPATIFAKDGAHDGHGAVLTTARDGRYLWVVDRFANAIEVVDMTTNTLVNTFSLIGRRSADPAPDLLALAPSGKYAFATLRGPCPLTANAPAVDNAVGATPGVGVIAVKRGGLAGELIAVAPIRNPSPAFACASVGGSPMLTERADPHGIAIRLRHKHD